MDSSTSTSDSETVTATATSGGNYTVHVYGYRSAKADYSLKVTTTGGGTQPTTSDDQYEENDSRSAAASIPRGTQAGLVCEDADWFQVTARAGEQIRVTIRFPHAEGDLDMRVYDSTGKRLASGTSISDDESVSVKVPSAGGHITIHVYGYQSAENDYSLEVR